MKPIIAAALLTLLSTAPVLAQPQVREQGQLVMENVPVTPPEVREALQRYSNTRSARFLDWLDDGSMLISTRFGQTAQLHRVTQPGGQRTQLTFFDEPVMTALAQPNGGGRFLYPRDVGGAEYFQGYLASLTGAEAAFTAPGTRNLGFVFSRDGRRLAWAQVTPGSGDYEVMLMEVDDPASRRAVHKGGGAVFPIDFSPDGGRLLLGRTISVQSSKRYLLDLASGAAAEINPSRSEIAYGGGEFTPDGRAILMLSDQGSEVARLVRYDLATKRFSPVGDGGRWEVEDFDLSADGRTLAYTINEEGRSRLVVQDAVTRRALPQPPLPVGEVEGVKFSPDGRRLAIRFNQATSPLDVWVWDLDAAELTRWTHSEMGGLDPAEMVTPELIRTPSFDGLEVPAWVYKPKRAGKAPVIVSIHGGPEGQSRPGFTSTYQYYVNELGAAVVVPNVRGSTGYGKTYVSLDNGVKRHDAVRDIGAILDWIAQQPDLDAERVVVTGGSYGGYMSLASLAHYNDRLAGSIVVVGVSNWLTFLANTEGYRRDLRRVEYGDERDPKIRAFLEQDSPMNHTSKMTKPLFVIHGFNDPRVPWTEGRQVVDKVRANGGEVWWLLAKDEGHGFRKKPNIDAQREAETLFLRKVFGE
ncbi:MAG: S9 family peptidase [Phenylobacterium sp.]|uniref:S9 family peptidase n=1 Tax=Phenylobacterium sp. TaxID=1871053 RepID=UPI00391ABCF2